MHKIFTVSFVLFLSASFAGCQRIETGEVGLRVGFDKQVQKTELQPGSFNQTIIGDVLVFPVKQIALQIDDLKPQTKDTSTLADLDITVIYNLNQAAIADLYTQESHSFNAIDSRGDTLLMYNYLKTVANSAAFKAVNKFNALDVVGNRTAIEADIAKIMTDTLAAEKIGTSSATLGSAITIAQVQVKNILPAQGIVDSANAVITAQNNQKAMQVAVGTAKLEAERQALLSRPDNIAYMRAKAELNLSEAALEGHIQTMLIPHNLTMFGMPNSK